MSERKLIICKFPFRYARTEFICMFVMSLIVGVGMILQVHIVSEFINRSMRSIEMDEFDKSFYVSAIGLVFVVGVEWLMPKIIHIIRQKAELKLKKMYRPLVLEKCAKLQYRYVEDSQSLDLINRVLKNTEKQWMDIYQAVLVLLQLIIKIMGVIIIISCHVWWSALIVLWFCVPLFILSIKGGKKNYQTQRETSNIKRKYEYLDQILTDREPVDERNLFGYYKKIEMKYEKSYNDAFWIVTKMHIRWTIKTKLSAALSTFAALIIILTLIMPTIKGIISVGLFISLVNAVFSLTSQMGWGLSNSIDTLVRGREFYNDMKVFEEQEEENDVLQVPDYVDEVNTLEFKHVWFQYPGTDYIVLRDVSFSMKMGMHYALVGCNGAGKSSVIKLLTGLYSDYQGEILINGKELREYTKAQQKGIFAVVYQDYVKHAITFRENCELGIPGGKISEGELIELLDFFELSDTIKKLSKGLDTPLGKLTRDSIDLSGGEWQKLAMIRALVGPEKVRVLDEPTAALDPKMESEVYEMFQNRAEGKMTILISHRLGFARIADEIIVFSNGQVAEMGNFDSLITKKGLFYQMYAEQRSWYE